ncbi:MAG TPA: glucosaminidase domain-containing protein [Polyangiaceae bacterium]
MSTALTSVVALPREVAAPNPAPLARADAKRPVFVVPVKTELSTEQASSLLAFAYQKVTGEAPTPECTALLTAQWAHETGSGSSMVNYNFGGIKGAGPDGHSVLCSTREGWGANEVRIKDGFRAYSTAEDGALDYVALLQRRYPEALEAAKNGDPNGMVRALKQGGYFTGNEAVYTRSVTRLASEVLPDSPLLAAARSAPPPIAPELVNFGGAEFSGSDLRASALHGRVDTAPFVGALALADEVSRAALSLLSATREDHPSRRKET